MMIMNALATTLLFAARKTKTCIKGIAMWIALDLQ